jgi:hypothetical protein
MKLKELATDSSNKLKLFLDYVNNIDFDGNTSKSKYFSFKDENGFYITADDISERELKDIIIRLVTKYWKNFEYEVDLHKYDDNGKYFIELKPESGHNYVFIIESTDNYDIYCKFDRDFIANL